MAGVSSIKCSLVPKDHELHGMILQSISIINWRSNKWSEITWIGYSAILITSIVWMLKCLIGCGFRILQHRMLNYGLRWFIKRLSNSDFTIGKQNHCVYLNYNLLLVSPQCLPHYNTANQNIVILFAYCFLPWLIGQCQWWFPVCRLGSTSELCHEFLENKDFPFHLNISRSLLLMAATCLFP